MDDYAALRRDDDLRTPARFVPRLRRTPAARLIRRRGFLLPFVAPLRGDRGFLLVLAMAIDLSLSIFSARTNRDSHERAKVEANRKGSVKRCANDRARGQRQRQVRTPPAPQARRGAADRSPTRDRHANIGRCRRRVGDRPRRGQPGWAAHGAEQGSRRREPPRACTGPQNATSCAGACEPYIFLGKRACQGAQAFSTIGSPPST